MSDNAEVGGSIPPSPTEKVLVSGGAGWMGGAIWGVWPRIFRAMAAAAVCAEVAGLVPADPSVALSAWPESWFMSARSLWAVSDSGGGTPSWPC